MFHDLVFSANHRMFCKNCQAFADWLTIEQLLKLI